MTTATFSKALSANDVGATGGHQGGILVPKTEAELLSFFPALEPAVKNPDAWVICEDEERKRWKFRFVYYNNKLHDQNGTRNEYRITYMTKYFRELCAREGDSLEISKDAESEIYFIRLRRANKAHELGPKEEADGVRIKLKSGWSRVH